MSSLSGDDKLISMRTLIGKYLNEFYNEYPNMWVLDADLAKSTSSADFAKEHPDQFVETGIAEQNALSAAIGIANEGGIPFFVDFAIFASGTVWTQLRMASYGKANVKIIATHPGMDGGFDGATHHALEDIALTRVIPGMMVLTPATPDDLKTAIKLALEHEGPVYIRCARDEVYDEPCQKTVHVGHAVVECDLGNDFALLYEGSSARLAKDAFSAACDKGLKGKLVNIYSIKPLDRELIDELARSTKKLVTIENHSKYGGLGGAVAEVVSELPEHAPLTRVGTNDTFTESGAASDVKQKYGLSVDAVLNILL